MTDSTEITKHESREIAAPAQQASQLLYDIVQASRDPTVDAAKTTALANLAMQMQDREAERRFRMAKHKALMEMPSISKRGSILNKAGGVQSRYSKFEDIHRVVKPILDRHGLTISFSVDHEGQMVTVQPILAYADDTMAFEERGGKMVLATDTTGSKNATQGAGSAASYGKRHQIKAMLNIVEEGEDDDAQGAAPALPEDRQQLVDAARSAATGGTDAYAEFFGKLSKEDKGFIGYAIAENGKTYHDQNKEAAKLYD